MEKDTKHLKCGFGMWGEGCGHGWCHGVKWLVWFAVILTVFVLGMWSGVVKTTHYYGYGDVAGERTTMMGGYGANTRSFGNGWMMRGYDSKTKDLQKLFGSITSVEGNKITISDNGGNAVVVLSATDTTIFAGQQEVSLNALAVGQDVGIIGSLDSNNQLVAKYIYMPGF